MSQKFGGGDGLTPSVTVQNTCGKVWKIKGNVDLHKQVKYL